MGLNMAPCVAWHGLRDATEGEEEEEEEGEEEAEEVEEEEEGRA